ncbi:MAG: DNA polymerase I [Cytophagales bacterium]|jgi:DNA polymerase-1|nr:DNA polymerase I [Bacteroidota bacterium]MBS1981878.1 DNA polymerase I [Bacteroidota bacterium]WHZ07501.1 MAG: DNA polymerase I [Cytophagales bacterium]
MAEQKKLFLLDAYALIYRAHFAFTKNPRINSKGHNTSVPFGFTNTLLEVIQKQKPTHLAVAFDTAAKTFRDEMFKEYKATRQETPEDIRHGTPTVKEILHGFNIPVLEKDGYEADDIIGTLATQAAARGFEVYMMTPDKDFGQLVKENVFLYKPAYMGNAVDVLGPKEVCEKWDIENVSQVIDILGLQGDTSDNIPGIPGIGPKTAAELLKKYKTVEGVVAHSAELKGKQKERVEQYGDQAILSKKLATIITDVPLEFNEEALVYKGPDEKTLRPILEELEFKTMLTRIFSLPTASVPDVTESKPEQLSMFERAGTLNDLAGTPDSSLSTYKRIESEGEIQLLIEKLNQQKEFSVIVATDEAVNFDFTITALVFSFSAGEAFYIPTKEKSTIEKFSEIFSNESIVKIGYNIKQSVLALKKINIEMRGQLFDALLAHYLIEPEASHDLGILCHQYLSIQLIASDTDEVKNYGERAERTWQLKSKLEADLRTRGHWRLSREVEMPLIYVLAEMEFQGVALDEPALQKMSSVLKKDSEKTQAEIFTLADAEFNIGSPKQLGEILFDKLKLVEKAKKTKTGQYATGEEVLLKLADEHAIAKKILDFRENEKLRSTYVEALPKMISRFDHRIHTDYRQAVAATGRLSSNNPNLQNIPIRTEKGRKIRGAFVPRDKNYLFMSADYSQIELRIAASFAKDQTMMEAFRAGRDIHTTTAAKVFKVELSKVTPDMRRKAKEVNFGILYGSTAFGLSQNLNIPRSEASEIIDSYFNEFSAIKKYMDDSINSAREKEYVETILGRRRYLRDINSRNMATRQFAERNAINAPIQGSAADIIKVAMISIHRWLQQEKLKTKMILQVHDELVFDLHQDEQVLVKSKVIELMKTAVILDVPMEVEVGIGKNWLEAH